MMYCMSLFVCLFVTEATALECQDGLQISKVLIQTRDSERRYWVMHSYTERPQPRYNIDLVLPVMPLIGYTCAHLIVIMCLRIGI